MDTYRYIEGCSFHSVAKNWTKSQLNIYCSNTDKEHTIHVLCPVFVRNCEFSQTLASRWVKDCWDIFWGPWTKHSMILSKLLSFSFNYYLIPRTRVASCTLEITLSFTTTSNNSRHFSVSF